MSSLKHLQQLNTDLYLQKIVGKLSVPLQIIWRKTVDQLEQNKCDINFSELVDFIERQARIAKHPVFSAGALQEAEAGGRQKSNGLGNGTPANGGESSLTKSRRKPVLATSTAELDSKPTQHDAAISSSLTTSKPQCPKCLQSHDLDDCQEYLQLTVEDRHQFLVSKKLCFSCYGQSSRNHTARSCRRRHTCATCGKHHPTGLHGYKPAQQQSRLSNAVEAVPDSVETCATSVQSAAVAMSIVMVKVCYRENEVTVYAALDSMSSACFITSDTCHRLGVDGEQTEITIKTMNDECRQKTAVIKGLQVVSASGGKSVSLPKAYVQDTIPIDVNEVPSHDMMLKWPHLKELVTEMPDRNVNIPVGLLIGANCSKALEPLKVITADCNAPFAIRTVLGWCVSGPMMPDQPSTHSSILCHRILARECRPQVIDIGLKEMMLRMYDHDFSELKSNPSCMSQEDKRFMTMLQSESKFIDGHYEVPLPFRHEDVTMPSNRNQAVQRMKTIKRRFEADEIYRRDYTKFMSDIIAKGYARKLLHSEQCITTGDWKYWYLPHHGVYHPQKPNKIRVVFDCSNQFAGRSLNRELISGPNLANSLLAVLIRFRQEKVAFIADIEAMFYQVKLAERHTDYVRFVWWPNGDTQTELADYKMTVHLFGATSSPGCANFALKKAADDNESLIGSEAADTLRRNFYVDDLLKSVASVSHAIRLVSAVKNMCAAGGFRLTKFVSNDARVLVDIPNEDRAHNGVQVDLAQSGSVERALGIHWCIENDCLEFRIVLKDKPLTRRGMLSTISSIYDPLGLASPFLLKGKKLLQSLCSSKLIWDDEVADDDRSAWEQWRAGLPALEDIKLSRCLKTRDFGEVADISLHHFSDASQIGYGQCSYIRFVDTEGKIHCSLVVGKSRVSPLKPVTVPRLELTAATVAVRVGKMLESELDYSNLQSTYWTDSKAVLGYINNEARRFHTFVANRVQLIRDSSDVSAWRHVNTDNNPADDVSRGLNCLAVNNGHRWFTGPAFLWKSEDSWPQEVVDESDFQLEDCEVKKSVHVVQTTETLDFVELLEKRVSNWYHLKKMIVIWLRFIDCIVTKSVSTHGAAQVVELCKAERIILHSVQRRHFLNEVQSLSATYDSPQSSCIRKSSHIYRLNPMMATDGLLRVGGRLRRSVLDEGLKHPIILPKNSRVTTLVAQWCHEAVKHGGRGLTLCLK